ncbi:hypothetical protein EYB25_008438 [Talaromyces marneffei]|uniref:C6 finger domain protein n=1 Tax=Talaromyces marneffei (strain ATCC 18224 / CBS 334.59 / QM 7333) TaxID=441960 RepID=B6QP99_TALMQ|nr:hypothetical protein PMAA_047720 [Talaromyces marneffei ATCC 18224]KAE8549913.1 hypothetical protein EYB25_008438 [Talaromyces marneffei]
MLQWRSARPPQMQDAIDYFLRNFVFDARNLSGLVGGKSIEMFDIVPDERGPGRTVVEVLDALTDGLLVIRAASLQTIEGRRKLHVKYRKAMGEVRESISLYPNSRALIAPIYLFALYEMIVNTSLADRTWQTHLNGMLAMIQHNHNTGGNRMPTEDNMSAARQFALSEETPDIQEFFSLRPQMDSIEKAWLLLDVTKARLRKLVTSMDHFSAVDNPNSVVTIKKIDVEKLRVSVKRIQRDLRLITNLLPKKYHPVMIPKTTGCDIASGLPSTCNGYYGESYPDNFLCTRWNEYRTLILITGDFLLKTGRFLYAGTSRPNGRETTTLTRMMKEAIDGIYASVAYLYDDSKMRITGQKEADVDSAWINTSSMKTLDALNLMWPLHCAVAMEFGATKAQRDWMKKVLQYMGCKMRIPKAMSLADTPIQAFTYSEVLAGLTLLGAGVLRSV